MGYKLLDDEKSPFLNSNTIKEARNNSVQSNDVMTVSGFANKTITLILITSMVTIGLLCFGQDYLEYASSASLVGGITGLILAVIMMIKKSSSTYLASPYAACEGLFLWGFVSFVEKYYPGVAINALFATIALLLSVGISYKIGLIKVNERFLSIFKIMTFGVIGYIAIGFVTSLFFSDSAFYSNVFSLNSSGLIGIGLSLFLIFWGSMSLVIDLYQAENLAQNRAEKSYEWYCSVCVLITVVYLYIEITKLLIRLKSFMDE